MNLQVAEYYRDKFRITTVVGEEDARDIVPYANFPTIILADPNLTQIEKLLLGLINSFYTNKKELYASNKFLANSLGTKPSYIRNILTSLEKKGYIFRVYSDTTKRQRQRIFISQELNNLIRYGDSRGVSQIGDTVSQIGDRGVSQIGEHTNKEYTTKVNNNLKGKLAYPYSDFINLLNSISGRKFGTLDKKAKRQFEYLVRKGVSLDDFSKVIHRAYSEDYHKANKFKYLTPEFLTRPDKFERYRSFEVKSEFKKEKTQAELEREFNNNYDFKL